VVISLGHGAKLVAAVGMERTDELVQDILKLPRPCENGFSPGLTGSCSGGLGC